MQNAVQRLALQQFNWQQYGRQLLLITLMLLVSACGFHLRGYANLSFKTIYINHANSELARDLVRSIKTTGVKIVANPDSADVVLEVLRDSRSKRILSLGSSAGTSTGAVREFELFHVVSFRIKDRGSKEWLETQQIENRRDFSYSDVDALGKAYEETQLYDNMREDAVRQIVRALAAHQPAVSNQDESADKNP